jgi:uncharacterized RDD family membrane protein YckC
MAREVPQFDTSIEIVTPENIAFRYRVAGPFRRLPAYLLDLLIRLGVFVGIFMIFMLLSCLGVLTPLGNFVTSLAYGATLVLWFAMSWFYGGLFETYWNGQTPGKRIMQVRVLTVTGQPIDGMQAVLRNVLRVVDMQPLVLCQLGLLASMLNDRFQRLGDLACGTMVVVEEKQWFHDVVRSGDPEVIRLAGLVPAAFLPSRSLTRALAMYVQRRGAFSVGRRFEIARHLAEPLRRRFDLPADTNLDLLLCGLYHRTFVTERQEQPIATGSPFLEPAEAMAQLDHGAVPPPAPTVAMNNVVEDGR